jgi:hypothetical protein
MCWEKSHIPLEIWRAGDSTTNVGESLHDDVYDEGLGCTLVGGLIKGQFYDTSKLASIQVQCFLCQLSS